MPHITLQCYPKGLNDEQLQSFANDLTAFVSERLNTPAEYISIDFQEMNEQAFKDEVWDKHIAPNQQNLLRKPQYQL